MNQIYGKGTPNSKTNVSQRRNRLSPIDISLKPLKMTKKNLKSHNMTNHPRRTQGNSMDTKIMMAPNMIDNRTPNDSPYFTPQMIFEAKVTNPIELCIPTSGPMGASTPQEHVPPNKLD